MIQDLRPELKNVFYLEAELTFNDDGTYALKRARMITTRGALRPPPPEGGGGGGGLRTLL
jgi:hypothetical protein